MIDICSVGGFTAVGKNMVASKCWDGIVIFEMGICPPALIDNDSGEEQRQLTTQQLVSIGALPDDSVLDSMRSLVKAIVVSHCHLDHIAAVPYLAEKYKVPIIGTAFTLEIVKALVNDSRKKLSLTYVPLAYGKKFVLGKNWSVELIPITHSTLECALVSVHTPEGLVLYANDFKLDDTPTIGLTPDYGRLQSLQPRAVVCESLYSRKEGHTPSEKAAQDQLRDVLLSHDFSGKALFVTMFASHIARMKAAVALGNELQREVVILGRSFGKYVAAAETLGLTSCFSSVTLCVYREEIEKMLKRVSRDPGKYFILCTGSQGEQGSILDRICDGRSAFHFNSGDTVVFSCRVIPHETNIRNREALDRKMKDHHVRIFKDVHASGHSSREDLRKFLTLVRPEHVIPAHGNSLMRSGLASLCEELGYPSEHVHLMVDGEWVTFK